MFSVDEILAKLRTAPGDLRAMPHYLRAVQGVVYGLPLVLMDITRRMMTAASTSGEYSAPINQFHRMRDYVDPDFKNVVRISRNSLWSTAWVDLDAEPFVLSHPITKGHYMVVQVMNMWTDNLASFGSRTGDADDFGAYLIAGSNWNGTPPSDVKHVVRCSTRYAWILVQLAADSPEDFPQLHEHQDGLSLTPLSAWGTSPSPPAEVPVDPTVDTSDSPFNQVRIMEGPTFFAHLARALKYNPPYPDDAPMVKGLGKLGLVPGMDLDVESIDAGTARGMTRALRKVWSTLEQAPYALTTVDGWLIPTNLGRYGTDYNTRAFIAFLGLGALCREDCVYPSAFVDSDGHTLDGTRQYTIHFEPDGLYPSDAGVWSISAYREHFYVRNPIERYGITGTMPLVFNADGSLDVYIQRDSPGLDKEPNWLPCPPSGPFNVTVRVYQPSKSLLDGRVEGGLMVESGSYRLPLIRRAR